MASAAPAALPHGNACWIRRHLHCGVEVFMDYAVPQELAPHAALLQDEPRRPGPAVQHRPTPGGA